MLNDHEVTIVELCHTEISRQLCASQLRRSANAVKTRVADVVYAPLFFTGANQSRACFFVRREQQVSETRHCMPDHVVNIPDYVIAGAVMSDRNSEIRATKSHRHRFFTIGGRQ